MASRKSMAMILFLPLMVAAMAAPMAKAQLGGLTDLLSLLRIEGILYCTPNGNIGVNGTSTPVFRNAVVQLQCGSGNVVATSVTNSAGLFSILLDPLQALLTSLLSSCSLVVNTPLASCNASLPTTGTLTSTLQLLGNIVAGLLNIIRMAPTGFTFNASTN